MTHPDDFCHHLPTNRHVNAFDSIHDRCYPKNLKKRVLITSPYASGTPRPWPQPATMDVHPMIVVKFAKGCRRQGSEGVVQGALERPSNDPADPLGACGVSAGLACTLALL